MICKECRSELKEVFLTPFISEMICLNEKCENFGYAVDIEYQARLDKVLSKFKKTHRWQLTYTLDEETGLYLMYSTVDKRLFKIYANNTMAVVNVSLKTVESLLEDVYYE